MKALTRAVLAASLLCLVTAGHTQTFTKDQLQEEYRSYLVKEGYRPEITKYGHIVFKVEGRTYQIWINEKDPEYFRLTYVIRLNDNAPEGRQKRLEAANVASRETKVAKAYFSSSGALYFSIEMFHSTPSDAIKGLSRMLSAIQLAYRKYQSSVKGAS